MQCIQPKIECWDDEFITAVPSGMERCFPFFLDHNEDDESRLSAILVEKGAKDHPETVQQFRLEKPGTEVSGRRSRGKMDINELLVSEEADIHPVRCKINHENDENGKQKRARHDLASIQVSWNLLDRMRTTLTC